MYCFQFSEYLKFPLVMGMKVSFLHSCKKMEIAEKWKPPFNFMLFLHSPYSNAL